MYIISQLSSTKNCTLIFSFASNLLIKIRTESHTIGDNSICPRLSPVPNIIIVIKLQFQCDKANLLPDENTITGILPTVQLAPSAKFHDLTELN